MTQFTIADFVEAAFDTITKKEAGNTNSIDDLVAQTERTGATFALREYTFDSAPRAGNGMNAHAVAFISDGRKPGESAGNGTGVIAMYDVDSDQWLRTSDYTQVTV